MAVDLTEKYTSTEWTDSNGNFMSPNYVFLLNEMDNYDEFVLQGSARSSKTYSIIQYIWYLIHNFNGIDIGVCRETTPTLKGTVLKDFIEIGTEMGLYDIKCHNRTDNIYKYNGNVVEFFALDDEGKARGKKRNIVYMNEANRLSWELAEQLLIRTTDKVIIDFNPSEIDSWIYDQILIRDTCAFIKTTYKHNPFLSDKILREMEHMRIHNPSQYRIFGLGERAVMEGQIYDNWIMAKESEFDWRKCNVWCMDFGATIDPTVISKFSFEANKIYAKELFYGQDVRNHHIMIHLFFLGYNEDKHILMGDGGGVGSKIIAELRAGFDISFDELMKDVEVVRASVRDSNSKLYEFVSEEHKHRLHKFVKGGLTYILGAIKGKDSIEGGIQKVKGFNVYLHKDSANAWNEYAKYTWKLNPSTRKSIGKAVDRDNHFMDTIRYGALSLGRYHNY